MWADEFGLCCVCAHAVPAGRVTAVHRARIVSAIGTGLSKQNVRFDNAMIGRNGRNEL